MTDLILTQLETFGIYGGAALAYLAITYVVITLIALGVISFVLGLIKKSFKKQLDLVVLKVRTPKFTSDENYAKTPSSQQELAERLAPAEAFFSSIGSLIAQKGLMAFLRGRNDYYSFEIVLDNDGLIYFYVAAPRGMIDYIQEQIHAQYPDAAIEESEDYNIFDPTGVIVGAEMKFKNEYILPLRTYRQLESDSLSSVTSVLAKLPPGTGASVQLLVRSAHPKWHDWGRKTASKAIQGMKVKQAMKKTRGIQIKKGVGLFGAVLSFFESLFVAVWEQLAGVKFSKKTDDPLKQKEKEHYTLTQREQEMVKGIEDKSAKMGLEVNLRIAVSAKTQVVAQTALENVANSFYQFNIAEFGNSLSRIKEGGSRFVEDFVFRDFHEKHVMIINAEEAASLFHFPLGYLDTPNIVWLESRQAPAPANEPKEGLFVGENVYRGKVTPIYMAPEDRRRHMYIIGMTGSGKSKFMDMLILRDIKAGHGACFIDPLGDDVNLVLSCIPPERANDVIYFDPSNTERFFGLNLLEYNVQKPEDKIFVVNQVFDIFDKLYDLKATGGPIFEQYMKNACMLVMDDPDSGSTLMEVTRVLSDEEYRAYKLTKCRTLVVKDFWEKEAQKAGGEASLQNIVPYISSKLTPFIANDLVRPIISQQKTTLDFASAMNNQKILLINLSKGRIGDINANLLGMIIIGKILQAAFARADISEKDRKDFFLYIDEFQNFLTPAIATILSEARKYRLCLTMAHQYIGQLIVNNDEKIKNAIFGNVGTKVSFRIGTEDAEKMADEYQPVFTTYDVMNVPKFNFIMKQLIDNANPPPFSVRVPWDPILANPSSELADKIASNSRMQYGKTMAEVDAEIEKRRSFGIKKEVKKKPEISLEDLFK